MWLGLLAETNIQYWAFYGYVDSLNVFGFFTHLYCLVGCLSMVVWAHVVLGVVLYGCVLILLCLYLFIVIEHVSHGKTLYEYNHYYCCCVNMYTLHSTYLP